MSPVTEKSSDLVGGQRRVASPPDGFPRACGRLGSWWSRKGEARWRWAALSREQQSVNVETMPGTFRGRLADSQERDLAHRWARASSAGPPRSWD